MYILKHIYIKYHFEYFLFMSFPFFSITMIVSILIYELFILRHYPFAQYVLNIVIFQCICLSFVSYIEN